MAALFVRDVLFDVVQLTTANTALNDPGATGLGTFTLPTATIARRINYFRVKAYGTTTAGMIRIFASKNTGTNKRLLFELAVTAITPSATVKSFEGEIYPSEPIIVTEDSTNVFYATTEKSENFHVFMFGGTYE